MRLNGSNISNYLSSYDLFERATIGINKKNVNEVQVNDGKDEKLIRIINKFKAGKKLTAKELSYLAEKSPEFYVKVCLIMKERERLELRMESAKTKEEVTGLLTQAMSGIKSMGVKDEFEVTAKTNQYRSAHLDYIQTEEYKKKKVSKKNNI